MASTLITGLGLVGTSYAQHALKRGEGVVFYDVAPRKDFLAQKLGSANVTVVQRDVRDLPALIETIQTYKCDTVIHTAGLIGGKVANPIYTGIQINIVGTINVAEAVRLTGVKRRSRSVPSASTIGARASPIPLMRIFVAARVKLTAIRKSPRN
jgi:nucleoside-diphosphate-sugar epimerase